LRADVKAPRCKSSRITSTLRSLRHVIIFVSAAEHQIEGLTD